MKLNKAQFCNLSTSKGFLIWLKNFSPKLFNNLTNHLRKGKGCGANSQKMLEILDKIMRNDAGTHQLREFLELKYPYIIKSKLKPKP
jgi:hypothetical protein